MTPDEPILLQNISAMEENIKEFYKHLGYLRDIAHRIGASGETEKGCSEELEIPEIDNSIVGRTSAIVNDMNALRYQLEKVENHLNRLV